MNSFEPYLLLPDRGRDRRRHAIRLPPAPPPEGVRGHPPDPAPVDTPPDARHLPPGLLRDGDLRGPTLADRLRLGASLCRNAPERTWQESGDIAVGSTLVVGDCRPPGRHRGGRLSGHGVPHRPAPVPGGRAIAYSLQRASGGGVLPRPPPDPAAERAPADGSARRPSPGRRPSTRSAPPWRSTLRRRRSGATSSPSGSSRRRTTGSSTPGSPIRSGPRSAGKGSARSATASSRPAPSSSRSRSGTSPGGWPSGSPKTRRPSRSSRPGAGSTRRTSGGSWSPGAASSC